MLGSSLTSGMRSNSVLMKEVALSQKEDKCKEVDATSSFSLILFYFFSNGFSGYTYLYDYFHHLKKSDTQYLF